MAFRMMIRSPYQSPPGARIAIFDAPLGKPARLTLSRSSPGQPRHFASRTTNGSHRTVLGILATASRIVAFAVQAAGGTATSADIINPRIGKIGRRSYNKREVDLYLRA
jgi:hypothetical protein